MWIYPDRFTRQFGFRQGVPRAPSQRHFWCQQLHGTIHDRLHVFDRMIQEWNTRHHHVLPPLHRCREGRSSCTAEYQTWFDSITRHFIVNPDASIEQYGWTGVHDLRLGNAAGPSRRHVATGRPRGRPLTTAVPPEPGTYYTSVGGAGGDQEDQQEEQQEDQQEEQQEDQGHSTGALSAGHHEDHFHGQTSADFTFGGSSDFGPMFTPFRTPSPYEYQTQHTHPQEQAHEHGKDRGETSHSSAGGFGGFLDFSSMSSPFRTPLAHTQTQHQTQWTQTQMHTQIGSQEEEEPAQDEPLIRRGPRREARHRGRRCGTGGHIGGQH